MLRSDAEGIGIPDERLRDIRRGLHSSVGVGPRGASIHLIDQEFETTEDGTYTTNKLYMPNLLNKASYGARVGDVVVFKTHGDDDDRFCIGVVTGISGDTVTFRQYSSITVSGDDGGDGGGGESGGEIDIEEIIREVEQYQSSAEYLDDLISQLNDKIGNTGGYVYNTEGQGIRTYDTEVSDPLVGEEAHSVLEIKGGTLRIGTKNEQTGEWDWSTIFDAGHIAAEAITSLNVTTGWIRGTNGTLIDLDSGMVLLGDSEGFHMVADAEHLGFYQGDVEVAYINNEQLHIPKALALNSIQVGGDDGIAWQWVLRPNGNLQLKWVGTEE